MQIDRKTTKRKRGLQSVAAVVLCITMILGLLPVKANAAEPSSEESTYIEERGSANTEGTALPVEEVKEASEEGDTATEKTEVEEQDITSTTSNAEEQTERDEVKVESQAMVANSINGTVDLNDWKYSYGSGEPGTVRITLDEYVGSATDVVVPNSGDIDTKIFEVFITEAALDRAIQVANVNRGTLSISSNWDGTWASDKYVHCKDAGMLERAFYDYPWIKGIDLEYLDMGVATDMREMFRNCYNLTSLDVGGWDTGNVTDMSYMFYNCFNLTSLDVSGWDTGNVTDMRDMFYGCSDLTSLDVSGFKTANVTNMLAMFSGCSGLTSLDVSGWDTGNVTLMGAMFSGCSGLTSLDVSGRDTKNVMDMGSMFQDCSGLTSLDVSGFKTENVTNMYGMFRGCSGLTSLDVSGLDTGNVIDMRSMFYGCSGLTSLDVSGFKTENVTSMAWVFYGCSGLTSLDVSGWDTGNVANMSYMFNDCGSLMGLNVSGLDTGNVIGMRSMFQGCIGLTSLDVSGWDTGNVTDMTDMFFCCSGLTSLDVSGWDTGNVANMHKMFYVYKSTPLFLKTTDANLLAYDYKADNRIVALVDTSKIPSAFDFSNTGWRGGDYGTTGNPWKIDYTKEQTFEAPNAPGGTSAMNMSLTATDSRLNDGEGFTYKVSRTAFVGEASGKALANPNLFFGVSLSNSEGWDLTGSLEEMSADQQKNTDITGKVINLDQDNVAKTVMRAEKGKSSGTSTANIQGVYLTVPASSHKELDTYQATVTWTLSDAPN